MLGLGADLVLLTVSSGGQVPLTNLANIVRYVQQLKGLCPRDIVSYPLNNRDYFASLGGVVMPNATPQTVR